jgi:hypothetical protein
MAVVLWGSKTPGERERDRDRAVSNNKKKVRQKKRHRLIVFPTAGRRFETGLCCGKRRKDMALSDNITGLEDT